jgi:hypothetical protein
VRVFGTLRQILRHALDEPQRQAVQPAAGGAAPHARDVVLERVDQFVTQHVIGLRQRRAERQDDAAFQAFGHAARALAGLVRQDVGLLEVGMIGVEDQRLAILQLVIEDARDPRVPALRHAGRLLGGAALRLVEIDVEVLGAHDLEAERLVLDLVAAEILRGRGNRDREEKSRGNTEDAGHGKVLHLKRSDG